LSADSGGSVLLKPKDGLNGHPPQIDDERSQPLVGRVYNPWNFLSHGEVWGAMEFRFEIDPGNKILLLRVEGRLTDELLAEIYQRIRTGTRSIDVRAGILDFSSVSDWALSSSFVRELAKQEPAMADAAWRRLILVSPAAVGFGLARMFQMLGESTRPLLEVVRTLEAALAALGAESAEFEPFE